MCVDEAGGGRREYFTKEEVYSTDRNGIDHISHKMCLDRNAERSEHTAMEEGGSRKRDFFHHAGRGGMERVSHILEDCLIL